MMFASMPSRQIVTFVSVPAIWPPTIFSWGFDGDTERQIRFGGEIIAGDALRLDAGLYLDASSSPTADAVAVGVGTTLDPVRFDLSYLTFFSQANRRGSADVATFLATNLRNIEYNAFTSNRITLTASVKFGRSRDQLAQFEYVDVLTEVFPAASSTYAFTPVGTARVRNISSSPIDARVSFFVRRLMNSPTESKPIRIEPGAVVPVPLYAVFNESIQSVKSLSIRDGDIAVHTGPNGDEDDHVQSRVLVRGRNDWNGDISTLKHFVAPQDDQVLAFTHDVIKREKSALDTISAQLDRFQKARFLYDNFARGLTYVSDPALSQDFVQYPSETLALKSGDCDDLSVAYASLLANIGISSAFVDVVPPDQPDRSHVYLLFDTGVPASEAYVISDNAKRYVTRNNARGLATVWIPVETTVIDGGFDSAWIAGAKEYYNDVEVNLGLVKGWVRIVDIENVY